MTQNNKPLCVFGLRHIKEYLSCILSFQLIDFSCLFLMWKHSCGDISECFQQPLLISTDWTEISAQTNILSPKMWYGHVQETL